MQSNLSTILSVLESSWVIVRGNLTMLISLVTTLLSVLLGSGFAVLNSLLNMVSDEQAVLCMSLTIYLCYILLFFFMGSYFFFVI